MEAIRKSNDDTDLLGILRRSTDRLDEEPIREETLSVERLEQYASELAKKLRVGDRPRRGRPLVSRLSFNKSLLLQNYLKLTEALREDEGMSPAAEWFIDNFHIVDDQMEEIKRGLPNNYYHELPKIIGGDLDGYPRVYALSLALISQTDSRLDVEALRHFIRAYQKVTPLLIGELWALPITLRVSLVEHLSSLTSRIVDSRSRRRQAVELADRLLAQASRADGSPDELMSLISKELGSPRDYHRAFIVQLIHELRDQDPEVWPAFDWLESQLEHFHHTSTHQLIQLEHNRQAAAQVTVGNIINSMRLLSSVDWPQVFESVSLVHSELMTEVVGVYRNMDFQTRDQYRRVVERVARRSAGTELEVAARTVGWANERKKCVGQILLREPGLRELERSFRYRASVVEWVGRGLLTSPIILFLSLLTSLSLIQMAVLFQCLKHAGPAEFSLWVLVPLLLLLTSEWSLNVVNHVIPFFLKPKPLPRMSIDHGLPENSGTMVVIPTLFGSECDIVSLLESLHVHFLGNQDPQISFALLGDFTDSDDETKSEDVTLLEMARSGIAALNARYPREGGLVFHLFCRRRQWNPSEACWMGWERKRGKLNEFNRVLRGALDTSFYPHSYDSAFLERVRYVITLDSDTRLPRDTALCLVATIVHPLNQPVLDPAKRVVVEGYAVLQPRIGVELISGIQTRFSEIFSANRALDPYTTTVSNIYQDLFGEGSFTGKGLYVVDAFEASLDGRVTENRLLSHDLFEGSFARCGLVADVELFDDFPSDYRSYSKRHHRWTRGDWQIAPWILPWVPDADGRWNRNPLSIASRWKIFDNLRRSLLPLGLFLWLLASWTLLSSRTAAWSLPVLIVLLFPVYWPILVGDVLPPRGVSWFRHLRDVFREAGSHLVQALCWAAFLPHLAFNQGDAIVRSLYRVHVSKTKKLEWLSFAHVQQRLGSLNSLWKDIWVGPIVSLCIAVALILLRSPVGAWSIPWLLIWSSNPWLEKWLRERWVGDVRSLTLAERMDYRRYGRRTWFFFERFVGPGDHWLAPDNFQEEPRPVVAHRSSPTNIGLQLLATLSAYDLFYLTSWELVEQLERTMATMLKMDRFHGHFYNWYDTQTLNPLQPAYVSLVDSGNLAGHLLAVKQGLISLKAFRTPSSEWRGVQDTLLELRSELARMCRLVLESSPGSSSSAWSLRHLEEALVGVLHSLNVTGDEMEISEWLGRLRDSERGLVDLDDLVRTVAIGSDPRAFDEVSSWIASALSQVRALRRDSASGRSELEQDLLDRRIQTLVSQCDSFVREMDFRFLYDDQRKLFFIGFNVQEGRKDASYYDLLASEARLASFVAIAKGDVPQEHWFRLGRQLISVPGGRALVSWTATMFEYLMPLLVMRRYKGTLLDQTYEGVVRRQIEYGKQRDVPWGISEAAYHARDLQLNYQYGPFGVPGLGLKRGLSRDLVVSPYSTALAAMVDPQAALINLRRLEKRQVLARFGFYESIDFTPERLPKNSKFFVLRSFMAHHQGMSLVAINNLLNEDIMRERFHTEPLVKATQRLLQEKIPQEVRMARPRIEEVSGSLFLAPVLPLKPRTYTNPGLTMPQTQILSNGTYSVLITSAGGGYSRSGPVSVTRWREDATRDCWGQFYYLRDRASGELWSSTYQPLLQSPDQYEVTFAEDRVEFLRQDGSLLTHTEILVSPEDNVELRRISVTNQGPDSVEIEITSFMEFTLALHADDLAHPAFSNLFIETEFLAAESALLATRRRRSGGAPDDWAFHLAVSESPVVGGVQYETDRARFLGRGQTVKHPRSISENRPLSNTVGPVLDPIFSLRRSMTILPGETERMIFVTGTARSREEGLVLADKYHDPHIFARESDLAWTKSQVQLRHLSIDAGQANTYQRLAGRAIYSDSSLRPRGHLLSQNEKSQSGLWAYGVGGDLPIILVQISDEKDLGLIRELLQAHEYLRLKGLMMDLVILNEHRASYLQSLHDEILRQIRSSGSQIWIDRPGGIFIRRTDLMSAEDILLFKSVARVTLSADKGTLLEQLRRRLDLTDAIDYLKPRYPVASKPQSPLRCPELNFFNGLGGFTEGGHQYVIYLKEGQWTPAPWVNVIANEDEFGFVVSESGSGYTWSLNSRENRLTSWSNDAVSDPASEALYIRDEETGEFWSPTPLPIRGADPYLIRHGQGYTEFEHECHGLHQRLTLFVPVRDSVKIQQLHLKNVSRRRRRFTVTAYVEWVLGVERASSTPHVVTSQDEKTGTLYARNAYNNEFASRVAFLDCSEVRSSVTGDRAEFLGPHGSLERPEALRRTSLSGNLGAGLDPCGAIQFGFDLEPGEEKTLVVVLGQASSFEAARALAIHYRQPHVAATSYARMLAHWEEILGTIKIRTPDEAMNILVNRWLPYQVLSCRLWARSGFYQSGGAYGFRDQLQDVMALVYARPDLTRTQLLRAAAHQFPEGDVQHWWHPPSGRGVRTRFSDDLLWLAFVASFYVRITGDHSIWDEKITFVESPLLEEGQSESYRQPQTSAETATLKEHCARAIDRSLVTGAHGLPLMGSGDWNDGMNRVGDQGRGESVWMAWFLSSVLKDFLPHCDEWDEVRAKNYREHLKALQASVEANAWDGEWYRRAYFDDGTPLGSSLNRECQIDAIAQSWAVLSGVGDPERARRAMASTDEKLVHRGDALIKLFVPPFDQNSPVDPGYIKSYLPGVRENGGQYTHAAVWTLMAFAEMGDGERAEELFSLLNPIHHTLNRVGLHKYKVEPYVMAADVYGLSPHVGRGGWTWYTGAASWMYRAAIETLLGFQVVGGTLKMQPRVPRSWKDFELTYRKDETTYQIFVTQSDEGSEGTPQVAPREVPLLRDGGHHIVRLHLNNGYCVESTDSSS